jgi:hypothetical protein
MHKIIEILSVVNNFVSSYSVKPTFCVKKLKKKINANKKTKIMRNIFEQVRYEFCCQYAVVSNLKNSEYYLNANFALNILTQLQNKVKIIAQVLKQNKKSAVNIQWDFHVNIIT